jgi:hypothetical protein
MVQAELEYWESPGGVNSLLRSHFGWQHGSVEHSGLCKPMSGPEVVYRYNRFRTARIIGQSGPGYSSDQAAAAMEQIADQNLPAGYGHEWAGTMYQQKITKGRKASFSPPCSFFSSSRHCMRDCHFGSAIFRSPGESRSGAGWLRVSVPAVGYRISAASRAVFYVPDRRCIYDRHEALAHDGVASRCYSGTIRRWPPRPLASSSG